LSTENFPQQSRAAAVLGTAARITKCLLRSPAHPSTQPIPTEEIHRILWIRLDHIGDVVMSLPALAALRACFPAARIDVLVRPGVAPLLSGMTEANRILTYDTPRFPERGRGEGLFRTVNLIHRLRRNRYDLAIEMRGDDVARFIAFGSGARRRLGPDRIFYEAPGSANFSFLMTHRSTLPEEPHHAVENNLDLLKILGCDAAPDFRFPVAPKQRESVRRKLKALGVREKFAAIHARSNDPNRDWTPERFAAVANHLVQEHDLDVVLTGASRDKEYNKCIVNSAGARVYNAAGCFSLMELPAFFEQAVLMVTVDTGPMHIAAAVSTPIVALMLPFLAARHYPYGQPDGVVVPGAGEKLDQIATAAVIAAIEAKLR
jgi:ADP-heptose:LPS heptosyltransferase